MPIRGYRIPKKVSRWKQVLTENILHIHSPTNTAPCYTSSYHEESIRKLGTENKGSTGVTCDLIVNGQTCGGTYYEYMDIYGTSHGQEGYVNYAQCNKCGNIMNQSTIGRTSGNASWTTWALTCSHGNEKVANFSINRKSRDLELIAEQDHIVISAYEWTYGSVVLSNTSSCKMGGRGTYTCKVTYTDSYSNQVINKNVSYTF